MRDTALFIKIHMACFSRKGMVKIGKVEIAKSDVKFAMVVATVLSTLAFFTSRHQELIMRVVFVSIVWTVGLITVILVSSDTEKNRSR